MGKILDFDQARREQGETPILRAFGRDLPIPRSVPAGFTLYANQLAEDNEEGKITAQQGLELLRHAVGQSTFDALMAEGLEAGDIWLLLSLLRKAWTDSEEDDEGEAQAPEQGAGSDT